MLRLNPDERPTLQECSDKFVGAFSDRPKRWIKRRGIKSSCDQYILFPARMGIPHRGHIEYMSRILDLGYKLIISIQRSYTITDRDPIPKWLVMKMVAQSLLDAGYSREDFKIYLTPFYRTNVEMMKHFAELPGREKIITVASSNPSVHELFPDKPIIEQKHVFCAEYDGNEFIPRSWGEIIRSSVKNNDYGTFQDYVAGGVEKILSFKEIQAMYGKPNIEFVPGMLKAVLLVDGVRSIAMLVSKYLTPEESLLQGINDSDEVCKMTDPYSRDTTVEWYGKIMHFFYNRTEFEDGDEIIYFDLLKQEGI
jgi:nicotinamide mononucleotide adenylyltransferase